MRSPQIQMFMRDPVSAAELSQLSGGGTSWIIGGSSFENLAEAAVSHVDIAAAPEVARLIAERINTALGDAILPASESDTTGRAVVIVGAGSSGMPDAAALLQALGLKHEVDGVILLEQATVTAKDYLQAEQGFCYPDQDDQPDDEHRGCVKAATLIMGTSLCDHFELNFSEEIVCAPVLYGGRASDGNLVAVLSMRVWT
jgi:hypothetical protein